jgi:hypothetical protein
MALLPYRLSAVPGSPIIWGEKDNIEYFLKNVLPVAGAAGLDKQIAVKASTVHRYPGDPNPYTRKGGQRRIYQDKTGSSVGTPGKRFWMEFYNPDDESTNEIRQFTCVGSQGLLRQQCKVAAKIDFTFRMNSGKAFEILVTAPLVVPQLELV